jgi:chromosome segregation ATPase
LEEQSHAGSARNEQALDEIRRELRQQEARIEAGDAQREQSDAQREQSDAKREQSLEEIREHLRRQQERIEAQGAVSEEIAHKTDALKGEILTETSAMMRGQYALLEQAENSIADLKDHDMRAGERIEALTGNLASLERKFGAQLDGSLKLAERLNESEQTIAQRIAALGDDLAGMDRKILAQTDRLNDRLRLADKDVALRLAALAENIGGLDRKLQVHGDSAHELGERLRAAENEMAQAVQRQRALAQLHSRLANTLLDAPEA